MSRLMDSRKKLRPYIGFFGWFSVTFITAAFISYGIISYYSSVVISDLNLPAWGIHYSLLPFIWFSFYSIQGIATWLVWKRTSGIGLNPALRGYLFHLGLSILATVLLFYLSGPFNLFIHSLIIFASFFFFAKLYYDVNRVAAFMVIPNLCWLLYLLLFYGSASFF